MSKSNKLFLLSIGTIIFLCSTNALSYISYTRDKTYQRYISNIISNTIAKKVENPIELSETQTAAKQVAHILRHVKYVNIDGNIRNYYYYRYFTTNTTTPNQFAFSLGGKVNLLTDAFMNYFRLGATIFTAQPLGINSGNHLHVDNTLPGISVTAVGQTFAKFESQLLLIRAGNQLFYTPWLNSIDSNMIPPAYQALYANLPLVKNLNLIAIRQFRYKSQISATFTQTNNFFPKNNGPIPIPALADTTAIGTGVVGARYNNDPLQAQAWLYQFYDYSVLAYSDIKYKFTKNKIRPIVAAQIGQQRSTGNDILRAVGQGTPKAALYGAMIGIDAGDLQLTVGTDKIVKRSSAYFRNGDIVSPYNYATDPLYTTSIDGGLIEKAAGTAVNISGQLYFCDHQFLLQASWGKYNTSPFTPGTTETDISLNFSPNNCLFKGLSITGIYILQNGNSATGRLINPRLLFEYDFA